MKIKMVEKLTETDFNKELEKILENKDFEVTAKNLLLSMLYKIENSYNDYSKAKVNVDDIKEQITEIIRIIAEYCERIEVVTPHTENSKDLEKEEKNCIVNIKEGYIKTYANEISLLSSLYVMNQKVEQYNKDKDFKDHKLMAKFYNEAILQDKCEIIRDFDGWSWNPNLNNNLQIMNNLLYQTVVILFGKENAKKVILKDEEFMNRLTPEEKANFDKIETLIKTYMALNNIEISEEIKKEAIVKKEELDLVYDKKKFLNYVTENKKKLNKEIGVIDEIINNEERLREEYFTRNSKLKNEEKIFSISFLEDMLIAQREEKIKQIKEENDCLNPTEYIKKKEKLEKEFEYYENLLQNIEYTEIRKNTLVELLRSVLKKLTEKITLLQEKENIKNIIYVMRYYLLLKVNNKEKVIDIKEIEDDIKDTINTIIDIAIDKEVLTNISDSTSICYEVIKHIFESRNIDLEDLTVKVEHNKQKNIIEVNIFDEQEVENYFEMDVEKANLINIKMKKRVKLFC